VRSGSARHRTWQAENPDFLLCRTRQTSACHCSAPSGLPTNCDAPFSTLPESLTRLTVHLRAHLPTLHSHGNKRILMGTWWEQNEFDKNCLGTYWEQKDIDGLLMGTKGIWLELDGNKKNLIGTWWEQEEFDENFLGTWCEKKEIDGNKRNLMGTWWEIKPPSLQKDKKHPLGACLHHPIGSPVTKIRNIPVDMLVPPSWRSSHALS